MLRRLARLAVVAAAAAALAAWRERSIASSEAAIGLGPVTSGHSTTGG